MKIFFLMNKCVYEILFVGVWVPVLTLTGGRLFEFLVVIGGTIVGSYIIRKKNYTFF